MHEVDVPEETIEGMTATSMGYKPLLWHLFRTSSEYPLAATVGPSLGAAAGFARDFEFLSLQKKKDLFYGLFDFRTYLSSDTLSKLSGTVFAVDFYIMRRLIVIFLSMPEANNPTHSLSEESSLILDFQRYRVLARRMEAGEDQMYEDLTAVYNQYAKTY
ncbi:hypothetical protein WISP_53596 [Willisornis vidua]|uniref:Uncharacterized protein n=1 Tax=Willisornis vidua TaxID=1566151 RepID=A0ABQ9DJ01_9PASS|nr:hypothetical protein WISP_53596 [Willisornis vidua]